jgi:hypothetical protein
MASKQHQEKGESNRIEWFQQIYREWKEKNISADRYEIYDYLDEDDCEIDLTKSILPNCGSTYTLNMKGE